MSDHLKKINELLLDIHNSVSDKNETMEDVMANFDKRKIIKPMIRTAQVGGKLVHNKMIHVGEYIDVIGRIENYEIV